LCDIIGWGQSNVTSGWRTLLSLYNSPLLRNLSFFLPSPIGFFFPTYICKRTQFGSFVICAVRWLWARNNGFHERLFSFNSSSLSPAVCPLFFSFSFWCFHFAFFFTFTCHIMILGVELHLGFVGFLLEITHVKFYTIPCLNVICLQNMCTLNR
jgi:hypothetical protein